MTIVEQRLCMILCLVVSATLYTTFSWPKPCPKNLNYNNLRSTDKSSIRRQAGEHLILNLAGVDPSFLKDESALTQATSRIIRTIFPDENHVNVETNPATTRRFKSSTLMQKEQDHGSVSIMAQPQYHSRRSSSNHNGHLTIHTSPTTGTALVHILLLEHEGGEGLKQYLPQVIKEYRGDEVASFYTILPHFESSEEHFISSETQEASKLYDFYDPKQDVKYYESFVHPTVMALAEPPQRVLIVGDVTGGILREILKYRSIEHVTMIEMDKMWLERTRKHQPGYSDCSFVSDEPHNSFSSCFDDNRVEIIYNQRFPEWFEQVFGVDICQNRQRLAKEVKAYDLILLDYHWPISNTVPSIDEPTIFSREFFERTACVLSKAGVLSVNFGEAPEGPFRIAQDEQSVESRQEYHVFHRKLLQIQQLSEFFFHTRVYDATAKMATIRGDNVEMLNSWAFVVGMAPRIELKDLGAADPSEEYGADDFKYEYPNAGVTDFDGKAARVNLKLRRWLKPGLQLKHYDGARQFSFHYPTADWQGVYCTAPENKQLCELTRLFTEDYDEEWFEARLATGGGVDSGVVAKKDIRKGFVSGLLDAATSLELNAFDLHKLRDPNFVNKESEAFDWLYRFVDHFGYEGTVGVGRTGEMSYTGILTPITFMNHACNHTENFVDIFEAFPWTTALTENWNPIADRLRSELNHVIVAIKDVKAGEWVTMDYSKWDGEEGNPVYAQWCGGGK